MKKPFFFLILLTAGAVLAQADDPTTIQVAPSDQIRYPDASQLLNKTDGASTTAVQAAPEASAGTTPPTDTAPASVPSAKPLVAATPIPVTNGSVTPAPAASPKTTSAGLPAPGSGAWFLKWTISGDESSVLGWAQALNRSASVHKLKEGLWEVWAGPFDAAGLNDALAGQAGLATLVRK